MDLLTLAVEALRLRSAHYQRNELGASTHAVVHAGSGIHLVEHGRVTFAFGKQRVAAEAGDVVLVPKAQQRRLSCTGRAATVLSGEFSFSSPDHPLLSALPPWFRLTRAGLSRATQWSIQVDSLVAELENPQQGAQALIARLTEVLVIHVMRLAPPPAQAECPASGWLRGLHDPLLEPVLGAMHNAPGHAWSLAGLAKLAGQSRSAFAAHFATTMGEPAMTYLARWRMFRARCLLRESELPLTTIAEEVGYGSVAAFSLAFRREHATSPGAFRAAARRELGTATIAYRPAAS